MPLGQGIQLKEQVTGKADHGGLRFDIFSTVTLHLGLSERIVDRLDCRILSLHMTPAELQVKWNPNSFYLVGLMLRAYHQ